MAELPHNRLKEEILFTYCGEDMFGLLEMKERRNTLKRYGALFTCFASCAIHIKMTKSMDNNSFILALWHSIGRGFNVRPLQCDNGSNFVGVEKELEKHMNEMDNKRIGDFLLEKRTD